MIKNIKLIRNVTQFESVTSAANIELKNLTLIYAENGRGKTSLASILRSAGTGNPNPIIERSRLGASHPPHTVLECDDGTKQFQNGSWNSTCKNLIVFDDTFVHENVFSGLSVDASHRQNLHELIIGAQGVSFNAQLKTCVDRIEEHNKAIRNLTASIAPTIRGPLALEDFCALPDHADIETALKETKKSLDAAHKQEKIRATSLLPTVEIAAIDLNKLEELLKKGLPDLEESSAIRLKAHFATIGPHGEGWVAKGMENVGDECPFCCQKLDRSTVVRHYQAYFSSEYSDLQSAIKTHVADTERFHGGEARATLERTVRILKERHTFWREFISEASLHVDTIELAKSWRQAFDAINTALKQKSADPLRQIELPAESKSSILDFNRKRLALDTLNVEIAEENLKIEVVKEQVESGSVAALEADLQKLKATRERYRPEMVKVCDDYAKEKSAKAITEAQRDAARNALNVHQSTIFPTFNTSINIYLQKFNADFRLENMGSANSRSGTSCTYNVVIYNVPVAVDGSKQKDGQPSFKTTLSAGDRNTLALAFYFASLDQHPDMKNCIAVIDDPMTSLDDHRTLTTVQEIRKLAARIKQTIVLSHAKPFLCKIWKNADTRLTTAILICRENAGSTIKAWDVNQDEITEYDRQHALLRQHASSGSTNSRDTARAIRPTMEGFLRVACPEHFPPGTLLGPFRNLCKQRIATGKEILSATATQELEDLVEYANKFHHDTNPAWETEAINDGELLGYVKRGLSFIGFS